MVAVYRHFKGDWTDNHAMESVEETLARLKFIGHIQKDEKIDTRHTCRQPKSYLTTVIRMYNDDNRYNTLKWIKDVITRSFQIVEHYVLTDEPIKARSMIADMDRAKQGIVNLKDTYVADTKICCDFDVIIEHITGRLAGYKEQKPAMFEESKN